MLHISKRDPPFIDSIDRINYLDFVTFCFTAWKKNLADILKELLSDRQIGIVKDQYKIDTVLKPTEIQFADWLILFNTFIKYTPLSKKHKVKNAFSKLNLQQSKLVKNKRTKIRS